MTSTTPAAPLPRWAEAAEQFRRWRDGDTAALDDLVRTLTPTLWHVARAYGLEPHVAEDVVQTSWTTFVRKHDSIDDPQAVSAWLTTTTRREAWRVSRLASRARPVPDEVIEAHVGPVASVEDIVVTGEESSRLWAAVALLPDRCRRLLRVIAFSDRPDYASLSEELEMPVGSIGPTRARCLVKLKRLIGTDESDARADARPGGRP